MVEVEVRAWRLPEGDWRVEILSGDTRDTTGTLQNDGTVPALSVEIVGEEQHGDSRDSIFDKNSTTDAERNNAKNSVPAVPEVEKAYRDKEESGDSTNLKIYPKNSEDIDREGAPGGDSRDTTEVGGSVPRRGFLGMVEIEVRAWRLPEGDWRVLTDTTDTTDTSPTLQKKSTVGEQNIERVREEWFTDTTDSIFDKIGAEGGEENNTKSDVGNVGEVEKVEKAYGDKDELTDSATDTTRSGGVGNVGEGEEDFWDELPF